MKRVYRYWVMRYRHNVRKSLTCWLFLFLPKRVADVFFSLVLLSIINKARDKPFTKLDPTSAAMFNNLLMTTYNDDILLLPNYMSNWMWNKSTLSKSIVTSSGVFTVREILRNEKVFIRNFRSVLDVIIQDSPATIKFKLNLKDQLTRLKFKYKLVTMSRYV